MTIRKSYSREFKLDAVSLVLDQGYTRTDVAKSLGINANMLGRSIRQTTGRLFEETANAHPANRRSGSSKPG